MSEADWLVDLDAIRATYAAGGGSRALFGVEFVSVERGQTVFRLPITPEVGGGVAGGVHGGVLAALADIAVVAATLSACKRGDAMRGTAELNISFLRPAVGRALTATGTILKKGSALAVGEVEIHNDEGALVAKARVTYAIGRATP